MIVDEAQDLTPMQLRMVARRARDGALTALGDVAQATGPVRYSSWGELLPHLPRGDEADVEELRHAYRVPREIMELALPLLEDDRARRRPADLLPNRRRAAGGAAGRRGAAARRGVPRQRPPRRTACRP